MKYKVYYKSKFRKLMYIHEKFIIDEINSILNMFDSILGFNNHYKVDLYLSKLNKINNMCSGA